MASTTFKPDLLIINKEVNTTFLFVFAGLVISSIISSLAADWSVIKVILIHIAILCTIGYAILGIRKFNIGAEIKVTIKEVTVTSGKFEQVIPINEIQEVSVTKSKRAMTFKSDNKKILSKILWGFNGAEIKELILANQSI